MDINTFLKDQKDMVQRSLNDLAFRRLQYVREIEKIDEQMKTLQGALSANDSTKREVDTIQAVEDAKKKEGTK
jgi:hypothetical protein